MTGPPAPHRSFWIGQLADNDVAPPISGSSRADVTVVGGGYVGLWTAIRIKSLDPGCDVLVLEADICGGGASGRNGGFVLSWWPKLSSLVGLFGAEEGVRIARQSEACIGEIAAFCAEHAAAAGFERGGWLWAATSDAQLGAWEGVVALTERLGLDVFERLPPETVARRAGSPIHRAGVLDRTAGLVQPAALCRGLRSAALAVGVRIAERSPVRRFTRTSPIGIECRSGARVVTHRLVIATNAWAAGIRELRGTMAVISSDMIVTDPVPETLAQHLWSDHLALTDSQTMVDYYRLTADRRVAFGKGGWTIALGGRIGPQFDHHPRRAALVEADFRRYYPALATVPIAAAWSGPIGRTQDSLPLLGRLGGRDDILYGVGWSGNGVGPSVLGGKVLASLALGRADEWSRHPLVDRRPRLFPPEPIRFVGAHVVRTAVAVKERAEARGARPPRWAVVLSRLAPAGLEDKD